MQIVVDGLLTNYHQVNPNRKNTLLILHGWRSTGSHWQKVLDSLPGDIAGIALDLPAFGSTQPLPGLPGVKDYAVFVQKFIDKLKLKNVFLLGHSFGGQVSVDFALTYPESIKHLILVSPACIRNKKPTFKTRLFSALKPMLRILPRSLSQLIFSKFASHNYLHSNPLQRQIMKKILYEDYSGKIKNISVPSSVIWGSEDKEIPNMGKFLAENIRQSELFVLYGVDHSPQTTAPEKLSKVLKTIFLKHCD
jgi:pimeloyl-ACP methyl ester carboxylesterase